MSNRPNSEARFARWPLGGALLALFVGAVDLTVISTVLPRIVLDLDINTADIDRYIWVVNAYLLAYIVAIPVVGRLSDVVGRGRAFQIALAVFLAGSILSATAPDLTQLIVGRAIQGAGGGALLPVTMALVGDLLPAGRRSAALGLVGAVDTLGWVLGPLWGAAIVGIAGTHHAAWRWVFWINLPVGVLAMVTIARVVPNRRERERARGRLDLFGALLLGAGLVLFNLGLTSGGEAGVRTGSALRALGGTANRLARYLPWLFAGGICCLAAFVWWQRRARHPLLPPALWRDRSFVLSIVANFLLGAALIAAMVDVPLVVALVAEERRISTESALLLAPFTLMMAVASFAGGRAAIRWNARITAGAGLVLAAVGYLLVWAVLDRARLAFAAPGLAVAGGGFGLAMAPIATEAIDSASDHDRGIAAASTILFRLLGMTLSLSALTAFGIHRLQQLSRRQPSIVRGAGESTADFFVRQARYIEDVAIPLSVSVVRETFLIAAAIAALGVLPILMIRGERGQPIAERSARTPTARTQLFTVDELVNVTQSGELEPPKIS